MKKAVFLDRDGVLNKEIGNYITHPDDFIINPGVPETLAGYSKKGYLLIVISNQGGVGRKLYSHDDLDLIHAKLISALAQHEVKLTEIYYCPHHPSVSLCLCRKPDSLMLEKAMARFHIDPAASVFIGDADRDAEAAKKAGIRMIQIEANSSLAGIQIN